MTDICVIGSLNVDVSYRMHRLPVAGETVLATDRARAFGGKGGNQAVAVAALGADLLHRVNARWFGGRAKLPGIAVPAKQAARFKPLTYTHEAATQVLGWQPRRTLAATIAEAAAKGPR